MFNSRLIEHAKVVPAFVPINATGAAQDGDWCKFGPFKRCCVIIQKGAWAGGTPAITLEQATTNAGAGAKALAFTEKWDGTALTDDILAKVAVSSNTFNLSTTANEFHCIEVKDSDLDINNGFKFIRVRMATPGANNDLVAALYVFYDAAYPIYPETQPTVIA